MCKAIRLGVTLFRRDGKMVCTAMAEGVGPPKGRLGRGRAGVRGFVVTDGSYCAE